ncbi:glycosyltransferase family 4 protein [Iningainema tapete]|uniref:Glycosyltransferase family 4 protein n=1 Tax=Iningainema tapete BLCC-T55 TaxID=2748662 RepID=A0A8J6XNR3_9CYAN|nr:glycosyltransferase family 4 protein [Iningainema tapete]MBD2778478.1 glycosyltransferase family 4 protein [Iningainema tapete BLCC-T55]
MHIIVLEQEPSSRRGGQEVVLLDCCRGLAKRGHIITLLYTKENDLLVQYQEFCRHTLKINRFTVFQPQQIFSFISDIFKVNQISITENTIVLSNQFTDTFFGYAIATLKSIPLACYIHLPPPRKKFATWQGIGFKKIKKYLALHNMSWQWQLGMKQVKHFIAVSQQTKLDWVNSGYAQDLIDVVYNGINLEIYKPPYNFSAIRKEWNIAENTKVISYVGRIDKVKGLETLIKAFAMLRKNWVNSKLLIAGKPVSQGDEYQQTLIQLIANLGVEDDVKFLGHLSNTTSLYQVSDVTVLPSLWSEPFGRVIIESMACGTPVVASRIGGICEILTGEFQNLLFEKGHEQKLAHTLNHIINWREQDPNISNRCRQHIEAKFTLDRMIDELEKVLEKRFPHKEINQENAGKLLVENTGK